jgi:predicted neuraminidase
MRLWFVMACALCGVAGAEIVHEHVIGKEYPGKYKHPASFTQLDTGDLYVAYYGGGGEYEDDSKVWGMRRAIDGDTWSEPAVIADTPFLGEGNPVVWQAPDGMVWLYYVQRYGDTWSDSRIKAKISTDGAKTWSDPLDVTFDPGTMVRSTPIVLNNGQFLVPIYVETGHDREVVGGDTASLFLFHDPKTRSFTTSGRIVSPKGNLQPSVVQIDENHLIAYCRRGGGYEPTTDGYMIRSESRDGGRTWSPGENAQFPNPNAAIDFIKLRNGHLLLVYNDNMNSRDPLTVAISEDNDKTWPHRRDIATGDHDFAYPVALQTKDGRIRVLYTRDERSTVMLATFEESDILGHTTADPNNEH